MNEPLQQPQTFRILDTGSLPASSVADEPRPKNPFVGLRPFETRDSDRFFGRRDQTKELLQRLFRTRFVAAVGGSGCGKSSLVRAGLIPALEAGFLVADRDAWHIVEMKPGRAPLRNLAAALAKGASDLEVDELTGQITRSRANGVLKHLAPALNGEKNVLLLVDQFEEIFRYSKEGEECARDDAAIFVSILLSLTQREKAPIYIVTTMRSDFIGECDVFPGLPEVLNRCLYVVPRLTRQQRREAIEGPIRLYGGTISPRLLELLLDESDCESDQLPVLQHALMRTWEVWRADLKNNGSGKLSSQGLDLTHYEQAGTLADALDNHANEALAEVDPDQARRIFQALTETDSANRQVRRPATFGELQAVTGASEKVIRTTIESFSTDGKCFLVWPRPHTVDSETMIDISHESLIRRWGNLTHWAEEEAESAAMYRRLEEAVAIHERDKKHRWHDPQLQSALEWWQSHHPNPAWAARVRPSELFKGENKGRDEREGRRTKRPDFHQVEDFLQASRAARDAANEHREIERKREQEREQEQALARAKAEQVKLLADKRKKWLLALAACLLATVVITVIAVGQAVEVSTQSKVDKLAAQATNILDAAPQRSLLLGVTAIKLGDSKLAAWLPWLRADLRGAEDALRKAVAMSGGLGLGGHTREIRAFAVSPDNHWLITGSADGTVFRWDMTSPQPELHVSSLPGADEPTKLSPVQAVAVGRETVAVGREDGTITLSTLASSAPGKRLTGGGRAAGVSALAISQDGHWLSAVREDGSAHLWELRGGRVARVSPLSLGQPGASCSVKISDDGHWLVAGSTNGNPGDKIDIWHLEPQRDPRHISSVPEVTAVELSPASGLLVTGDKKGIVHVHRLDNEGRNIELTVQPATGPLDPPILSVAISSDERWIVTGHAGSTVRVRELVDGKPGNPAVVESQDVQIIGVKISPDRRWLVTVSADGPLRLWNFETLQRAAQKNSNPDDRVPNSLPLLLRGHDGAVSGLAFSSDSQRLLTAGADGTVHLWNLEAPAPNDSSVYHQGEEIYVTSIALSASGRWLAIGGGYGETWLWDLPAQPRAQPKKAVLLSGNDSSVLAARMTSDEHWLLTGSVHRIFKDRLWDLRLWDLNALSTDPVKEWHKISAFDINLDNGQLFLCEGDKGAISLWQPTPKGWARTSLIKTPETEQPLTNAALSPDGKFAATSGTGSPLLLWNLEQKRPSVLDPPSDGPHAVSVLKISANNRWLVAGLADGTVRSWELTPSGSAGKGRTLGQHKKGVTSIAFHPQNSWALTASEDGTARLFNLAAASAKDAPILSFDGHRGAILTLAVSPDGKWLSTGGQDGTMRLWRLEDLETLAPEPFIFPGHDGPIKTNAFSKDSSSLRIASLNGTARQWSLRPEDLIRQAQVIAGRNFSQKEWKMYFGEEPYQATFPDLESARRASIPQ